MSDYCTKEDYKEVKRRYKEEKKEAKEEAKMDKKEAKQEAKEAKQEAKEERKEEKRNNKIERKSDKIERKIERIENKLDGLNGKEVDNKYYDQQDHHHHHHHHHDHNHEHHHHEHHNHDHQEHVEHVEEPAVVENPQPVKHYYAYRQIQPTETKVSHPVEYFTVSGTTTETAQPTSSEHTPVLLVTSTSDVFTSTMDQIDNDNESSTDKVDVPPLNFASNDDASPEIDPQNEPPRVASSEPEPGTPVPETEPKY